jgi:hypothetical protein
MTTDFRVATAVAVIVVSVFGVYFGLRAFGLHESRLVVAFLLGVGLASIPWAFWTVALTFGGGSSWLAGGSAEEWTGQELARFGRQWKVVHGVPFDSSWRDIEGRVDVDHLAIGPYGVLVFETKWTNQHIDLADQDLPGLVITAAKQATGNAGRIQALLARDVGEVPLVPVVVLWGPNVTAAVAKPRDVGGARVVRGKDAASWRGLIESAPERMEPWKIEAVDGRIARYVEAR